MAIQVFHKTELGKTLEYVDAKTEVKLDNSGNVQLERTEAGLKASVVIPAAPEVPAALNGATIQDRTITFTKTQGEAVTIELPAFPVDVKLQSLAFTPEGKLKATLSDNSTAEVDFTAEVVVKALESATQEQKTRLKAALLDTLKGEEVQDFAGATKGYLLAA